MRARVVMDIDGVIARWGDPRSRAERDYSRCELVPGADMALFYLANLHEVIISSARRVEDMAVTVRWLEKHGILPGSHYTSMYLGSKPHAALYVDDRAYPFRANLWTLAEIEKVSAAAKAGITNE